MGFFVVSNNDFEDKLAFGRLGESKIAQWFKRKGFNILPIYEIELKTGKGPRLFTPQKKLISPDMLVFRSTKVMWIEAKHKKAFSWHRISSQWVTGIDLNHYENYCEIEDMVNFPVYLMFLHEGGQAKDSPQSSPSGLFGNRLKYLRKHENHKSMNWGKYGMVYWSIKSLKKFNLLNSPNML